mmetsp:Transcript_16141/g.30492  ORF Transcript_16141/g.30492 Transcript_16141/m.30492 type:complete len:122 (+) Transcript_16141:367-732(+)
MGASSSKSIGWPMSKSRPLKQSILISGSVRSTCFPGLAPRTFCNLSIITLMGSIDSPLLFPLRADDDEVPEFAAVPEAFPFIVASTMSLCYIIVSLGNQNLCVIVKILLHGWSDCSKSAIE